MHPRRLDDALDEVAGVEGLGFEVEPARVELVREQDLVHDPAQPLGLVGDQRDEALAPGLVEREVVPEQRLRRAVDGGQRRAQLVRGGGDEVGLDLLEPARVGQVAERVDRAAEEAHPGDRDPAFAARGLDRDQDLVVARVGRRGDGNALDGGLPAGDRLGRGVADDVAGGDERDRLGGGVPEPHDADAVEQQDAVGDVLEHPGRVGALLDLAVEPRPVEREGEPGGEVLGERDVLGRVRRAAFGPCQREHAELLLSCQQGDGDDRARLEVAERHSFRRRALVDRRRTLVRPCSRTTWTSGSGSSAARARRSGWSSRRARQPRGRSFTSSTTSIRHQSAIATTISSATSASAGRGRSRPRYRSRRREEGPAASRAPRSRSGLSLGGLEQLAPVVAALQLSHVAQEGLT